MLISRNWLQSHFETELPKAEKIAETLMMHSFELEGIHNIGHDQIIDIDVLPNRAHDCLSHAGVAREYSVLTDYELKTERYHYHDAITYSENQKKSQIENTEQCSRYITRVVNNIVVQDSPLWIKERIESIGQRSINNIVDATNYVMFDLGNPMHVFDADKVVGDIIIRNATKGESMVALGGDQIELTSEDLVIADSEGILALAGVKGGTKAEVDINTKNIIIEVANFNPTTTRNTARRVKILTDSSKRFENQISSELAPVAMEAISRLITDIMPAESLGPIVDNYSKPEKEYHVSVSVSDINSLLGLELDTHEIQEIFQKMDYQFSYDGNIFNIAVPSNRFDLRIAEDLVEEIGRIYGYHNIPTKNLDDYDFEPRIHAGVFIENTLKNILVDNGFSELKNYSFVKKGDIALKNPIASNKSFLRKNLYKEMLDVLEKNHNNIDFFGSKRTLVFEIGRIYTATGESDICCIAVANKDKQATKKYGSEKQQLENIINVINDTFSLQVKPIYEKKSVSFPLQDCIGKFDSYAKILESASFDDGSIFHSVSAFPYMTRDISLWAPTDIDENSVRKIINIIETKYLKKIFLFDTFEKEGRVSYGFSLIFQSNEKTLTDEEIGNEMMLIEQTLIDNNCEIR